MVFQMAPPTLFYENSGKGSSNDGIPSVGFDLDLGLAALASHERSNNENLHSIVPGFAIFSQRGQARHWARALHSAGGQDRSRR